MRISDCSSDVCSSDLVELVQHHLRGVALDLGAETDLRQAHVHRHLAAFEAGLDLALARARERALVAAAGGLAQARTDATTDALALLARAPGRSDEHTSELQSLMRIADAAFRLQKKN